MFQIVKWKYINMINKRNRISKGQYILDNPYKLATNGTQNDEDPNKNTA